MSDDVKKKNENSNGSRGGLLRNLLAAALVATSISPFLQQPASAQQPSAAKPNILVIFGDDVGQSNISAYTHGVVG